MAWIDEYLGMTASERDEEVETRIAAALQTLLDDDSAVNHAAAETNASDWEFYVEHVRVLSADRDGVRLDVSFAANGDHDLEKVFAGDVIVGTATVAVGPDGGVRFSDVTAQVADWDEDDVDEVYGEDADVDRDDFDDPLAGEV